MDEFSKALLDFHRVTVRSTDRRSYKTHVVVGNGKFGFLTDESPPYGEGLAPNPFVMICAALGA